MSKFAWAALIACVVIVGALSLRMSQSDSGFSFMRKEGSSQDFNKWHHFVAKTGQFRVSLPSLPQHATEHQGDPSSDKMRHYDMYVSEAEDGSIFMISLIKGYQTAKMDANVLSHVMNEMLTNSPQNKINKMEIATFKNSHPAMDFSLENSDVTIDGKAFTDGEILYVLTNVSKKGSYKPANFQYFVDSFELLTPTKK